MLDGLKTVKETLLEKREEPLADNQSLNIGEVVNLRSGLAQHQVREAEF